MDACLQFLCMIQEIGYELFFRTLCTLICLILGALFVLSFSIRLRGTAPSEIHMHLQVILYYIIPLFSEIGFM